jgi:hypothetical protein
MTDFTTLMNAHNNLPEEKQKQAGQAMAGDMNDEHANFLKTIISMIDRKEIDASDPQTFLKHDVYDALPEEWRDKVDLTLINLAEQLRLIEGFYRSEATPNSSPHLQTMIEQLWQMKQRIEKEYDVFKF